RPRHRPSARHGKALAGPARPHVRARVRVCGEAAGEIVILFPGCGAARSGAPLIRDRPTLRVCNGPGSAAHHSASLRAALRPGNGTSPYNRFAAGVTRHFGEVEWRNTFRYSAVWASVILA